MNCVSCPGKIRFWQKRVQGQEGIEHDWHEQKRIETEERNKAWLESEEYKEAVANMKETN